MVLELTILYWTSDVAQIMAEFIGHEAVSDIVEHGRRYTALAYRLMDEQIPTDGRFEVLSEIVTLGSQSALSGPLLDALARHEEECEWREDIGAAASDWSRRVLEVNLRVYRDEMDELIEETEGRILEDWDVRSPEAYAHYKRFQDLQLQGRIHDAISELEKAVELDPMDPGNHFTLGSVKSSLGRKTGQEALVKQGLEACWIAVTLDPAWSLPWTEIGLILIESGRAREAVDHLKGVRPECRPLDSRYYAALGAALRDIGELSESLRAFESSLELQPDDPNITTAAAVVASMAGDRARFNRYSKMANHLGAPEGASRTLELAKALRVEKTWRGTRKPEGATSDASTHSGIDIVNMYLHRAGDYFGKGNDAEAIEALDSVLRLEEGNVVARLFRGIFLIHMKRYDEAITNMTEVIRLEADNALAHYYRGVAYGDQNKLDLAVSDLDEAIRLDPQNVEAYRARGDCHRYREEYDTAVSDYDLALQLNSEDALSYRGRGAAYRTKKDFDRAIADYDSAVNLNPTDPLAYRFRGDAHVGRGDYETAVLDFDVALEFSPDDDIAYFGRGNAHLFLGELELAIADLDAALERNPDSARAYYCRGLAHELARDRDEAEEDYRRARELGYDEGI